MSCTLDPEIVGSERGSTDRVNRPVVASTRRHTTALDEELIVGQRVPYVVVPARLVVRLSVVVAVLPDVAADISERETHVG